MKNENSEATKDTGSEVNNTEDLSFNSATNHYQTIMGMPKQRIHLKSMPKPLRWFGYFFYSVLIIGATIFLIALIMQK